MKVSLTPHEAGKIIESLKWSVIAVRDSKYTDPGKSERVREQEEVLQSVRDKIRAAK